MSAVLDALVSTADTSRESYSRIAPKVLARRQRDVLDIVLGLQRNGAVNVSRREIQASYERVHGKRIDMSSVASSVHALLAAGRLYSAPKARECSITGKTICPVAVVASQAGLV